MMKLNHLLNIIDYLLYKDYGKKGVFIGEIG